MRKGVVFGIVMGLGIVGWLLPEGEDLSADYRYVSEYPRQIVMGAQANNEGIVVAERAIDWNWLLPLAAIPVLLLVGQMINQARGDAGIGRHSEILGIKGGRVKKSSISRKR